jgi:hypothetical protein
MNWTAAVDIYCERLGPGLLAEPLNAVTNASFFVAAWLGWRAAKARGRLDWPMRVLIGLTVAVGVGSTLFHTFAQRWAGAADVIPILLFILAYFGLTIWRYFRATRAEAVVLAAAFLFFANGFRSAAASVAPPALSPAIGYMPALVALVVSGGLLLIRGRRVGGWLLGVGLLFGVSLTFRALDQPLCEQYAMGTHFLWHILNGAVLGLLLQAWIRHGAPSAPAAPAPS